MADRSPLPGMDPWLESHWGDVHQRLITYGSDQIESQLPPDLIVKVEETVYVIDRDGHRRVFPDVAVIDVGPRSPGSLGARSGEPTGGAGVVAPVRLRIPNDPVTIGHIEICEARSGRQLVTVIEVVSPVNKLSPHGREQYLRKRNEYVNADVNVVEVDLLRAGRPVVGVPPGTLLHRPDLDAPYKCCVYPAGQRDEVWIDYYPMPLRDRLARIGLPLRLGENDVPLDLQSLIDQAYEKGRYARHLDYSQPPDPPLSPDDAAWAAGLVAARRAVT